MTALTLYPNWQLENLQQMWQRTLCKQHAKMAFKQSDKFSIINYRYTHPSKHAVDGLGSSAYQAIEL
eukprot:SAG22_NODE_80_length_21788_cov_9.742542_8_plen_67_part_00